MEAVMSVAHYWMGKDLDLDSLWQDFDNGVGYVQKVSSSSLHVLRLTFAQHPLDLPLFDHEAVFKTVKGTFHDVKAECFSSEAYSEAAPIFLQRVDRGSAVYEFLAELYPLTTWIVALGAAVTWCQKSLAARQKSVAEWHALAEQKLAFIKTNFPDANAYDVQAFMNAWTIFGSRHALHRLIGQRLEKVEVSLSPHSSQHQALMVDMNAVVELARREEAD
jgi:hypothetical protein